VGVGKTFRYGRAGDALLEVGENERKKGGREVIGGRDAPEVKGGRPNNGKNLAKTGVGKCLRLVGYRKKK